MAEGPSGDLSSASGALTSCTVGNKLFSTQKKQPDKVGTGKTEAGMRGSTV